MIGWRHLSIRSRLAVSHAAAITIVLAIYAIFVFEVVRDRFAAEVDHRLDQEVELAERSLIASEGGRLVWRQSRESENQQEEAHARNVAWFDVHAPDGTIIHQAEEDGRTPMIPFEPGRAGLWSTELPGDIHLRLIQKQVSVDGVEAIVRAALREDELVGQLNLLLWVLALGLPAGIGLAGFGGYWLAGRALAPISEMALQARAISAERLAERLPVANPRDELGQLASVFNNTLQRLEASFLQLRQFTADASHELRTPLTALRSVGEVALREKDLTSACRETIGTMLEETDRLTLLIDGLLTLARADSRRSVQERRRVDLAALARRAAAILRVLAEEKGQQVIVSEHGPLWIAGDEMSVYRALINLIDNAIRHCPASATIRVDCGRTAEEAWVAVADNGPGISAEHRERVFERFYRVDKARGRAAGGFGLGLAVARWAAEANGGHLSLESDVGRGSIFTLLFPALKGDE